jgi:hypothetical protein
MFDLNDKEEIITDEQFHSRIDHLLGNVSEAMLDEEIDPAYFSTPWAHPDLGWA